MNSVRNVYSGRLATTLIFIVAIFLCSLSIYTYFGATTNIHEMLGDVNISLEVKDNSKVEPFSTVDDLKEIEGIQDAKFIGSDKAEADFSEFVGMDVSDFMGELVLPSAFVVTIDASYVDEIKEIKNSLLSKFDWIEGAYYDKAVPQRVEQNLGVIRNFIYYLSLLLGVCSLLVGFLAVKLSIGALYNSYSPRQYREVRSQCLNWAWIQGATSGIFAAALLYFSVLYLQNSLPNVAFDHKMLILIAAGSIAASTICSLIFTVITVKK